MDLVDEVHIAMLALGAPSEGISFLTENEVALHRAVLDVRVAQARREADRLNARLMRAQAIHITTPNT